MQMLSLPLFSSLKLISAACLAVALSAACAARADSMQFGSATLDLNGRGLISSLSAGGTEWVSGSGLVAQLADTDRTVAIPWDAKPQVTAGATQVDVSGILPKLWQRSENESMRYTLGYTATAEGALNISGTATYMEDAKWRRPLYYYLSLPVDVLIGGSVTIENGQGIERTYVIGDTPLKTGSASARRVSFVKDGKELVFEAGAGCLLLILDSRAWGADTIRIDITAGRKWAQQYEIAAGTADAFEATVSFTAAP